MHDEGPQADEFPIKIPEGIYDAVCYRTETAVSFGGGTKIYVKFRIYGGEYNGTELFMVCNYPKGKVRPQLKYYVQWMMAKGRRPYKNESLSPRIFRNRMFKVMVRDAKPKFPDGKLKPDFFRYSIVDTIIEAQT
jgi:hypothetical protein